MEDASFERGIRELYRKSSELEERAEIHETICIAIRKMRTHKLSRASKDELAKQLAYHMEMQDALIVDAMGYGFKAEELEGA